jgi:hypothetical protein
MRERAQRLGAELQLWTRPGWALKSRWRFPPGACITAAHHVGAGPGEQTMTESPASIGVLVVDDHPLLRDGLAALLGAHSDLRLLGEAADGEEAIAATSSCSRTWC